MRTGSAPVGESHIPELSQQIGDGPCEMSPCLPPLNALQCVSHALQTLGSFLSSVVLIWHYAGKGALRHLHSHKVAHCKVSSYILESALPPCLDLRIGNGCSLSAPEPEPRLSSKMCGFIGCVLFLFYSSQQPWEINHDIITSWYHPRFTTEGHWAIYPQRRRTTAKKPLLSARLVTMSDSQEKAEGRQLLMLNCAGSCPFSDGKCCREWLCHWSPALWCSLASQWPVNEQWTQKHSQVIVDFGLCSFCCQVHLRNQNFILAALAFPFAFSFF